MSTEKKEYRYYSTQRPVDIGTYPKPPGNLPLSIENYDGRGYVECDTRLAWGHLIYAAPLTEQEISDYELRPSRDNPDLKQRMYAQAQVVGKLEDDKCVPKDCRLTWWYPDFGSYVLKEFVTPEKLNDRFELAQALSYGKQKKKAKSNTQTAPSREGR